MGFGLSFRWCPKSWYAVERVGVQSVGTAAQGDAARSHVLADEQLQRLDGSRLHRDDGGRRVLLGAEKEEAAGSDKLKVAYQVCKDEACDVSPDRGRRSARMAGRGRKRPGRCCLRRSSSCCASSTAGSRSETGGNTLKRCLPKSPGGFGISMTPRDGGSFAQRLGALGQWAGGHHTGIVVEKV